MRRLFGVLILLVLFSANSSYEEGSNAFLVGDYAQALERFSTAARAGDARAQYKLGMMYQGGYGAARHYGWALVWYLKAARQGHLLAKRSMGLLQEKGLGLSQNYERAAYWYRKAAEEGDVFSQNELGGLYAQGLGVQRSLVLAYRWSFLAWSRTDNPEIRQETRERLDWLAGQMTAEELADAEWRVRQWRPGLP